MNLSGCMFTIIIVSSLTTRFIHAHDDLVVVLPLKRLDYSRQLRNLQTTALSDDLDHGIGTHDVDIELPVYQGIGEHIVEIFVGCPPQKQTVIVDTGSSVTGFPCSKYDSKFFVGYHLDPYYQVNKSSCFEIVQCEECTIGRPNCNETISGACDINYSYLGGASWHGYEVQDKVSLDQERDVQFNFNFACETNMKEPEVQLADGIMGMGKDSTSFWRQMLKERVIHSAQFSLCFLKEKPILSYAGYMSFGRPSIDEHKTPIVYAMDASFEGHFFLAVKQIYLRSGNAGSSVIPIKNSRYNTTSLELPNTQYMALDSGTTITYIKKDLMEPFSRVFEAMKPHQDITEEDLSLLPTIIFQIRGIDNHNLQYENLAGTLDPNFPDDILVAFPPTNYLFKISGRYHLGIRFVENTYGILGANFLSGHYVVHDPDNNRIGFAESHCDINAMTIQSIPTMAPSRVVSDVTEPTIQPVPMISPVTDNNTTTSSLSQSFTSSSLSHDVMQWFPRLRWQQDKYDNIKSSHNSNCSIISFYAIILFSLMSMGIVILLRSAQQRQKTTKFAAITNTIAVVPGDDDNNETGERQRLLSTKNVIEN